MITTVQIDRIQYYMMESHGDQTRKYPKDEPYYFHCMRVANLVYDAYPDDTNLYAVAMCHDLFEDTSESITSMSMFLKSIGVKPRDLSDIIIGVDALTNVFTSQDYPEWNRRYRKKYDSLRLRSRTFRHQTVKYADTIDNCNNLVQYNPKFAKVYLNEIEYRLKILTKGETSLYHKAVESWGYQKKLLTDINQTK